MIELSLIRTDGGTQSRVELNQDTVAEYAEAYRNGAKFPPVKVFFDGADRWLADGFHRYFGAKAAGQTSIYEEIVPGTKRDARLYSYNANAAHGLPRSNADKHKVVLEMLEDSEWSTWNDVAIAKACAVSSNFVGTVRKSIINPINDSAVRKVERNGKTYEQNTTNIGKAKPKPVQEKAVGAAVKPPAIESSEIDPVESDSTEEDFGSAEDYGPSDAEINHALAAEANQLALFKELMLSADPLAKAIADLEMERRMNSVLRSQNNGHMNKHNALVEEINKLKRKIRKLGGQA